MISRMPGEEGGQGEADEAQPGEDVVEPGVLFGGGDDAERDRDQHRHHVGQPDHPERGRDAEHDQLRGRDPAGERVAPIALDVGRQPLEVAHVDRLIQAELLPNVLTDLDRNVRALGEVRERVAGRERQDGEDHEADHQDRRNGDQDAAHGIRGHGQMTPVWEWCRPTIGMGSPGGRRQRTTSRASLSVSMQRTVETPGGRFVPPDHPQVSPSSNRRCSRFRCRRLAGPVRSASWTCRWRTVGRRAARRRNR